jgi:hypothetical protein
MWQFSLPKSGDKMEVAAQRLEAFGAVMNP